MNATAITNFKQHEKGALKAFFSVTLPSGLILHECKLFEKEGRRWIGLPSQKFTDKAGVTSYKPTAEFSDRAAGEKFREMTVAAIDALTGGQKPATQTAATAPATVRSNSGVPRAVIPSGPVQITDDDIPF